MVTKTRECALCSGHAPAKSIVIFGVGDSQSDGNEIPVCEYHGLLAKALFGPALPAKRRGRPKGSIKVSQQPTTAPARKKTTPAAVKKVARRSGSVDMSAVREWAWQEGYDIGARGRIPADVIASFKKAAKKK